jgi:D-aminoacyl-tRNA deacylase
MRAVVQRIVRGEVTVEERSVGRIGAGLCALVAVGRDDADADAYLLADKLAGLRIFEDSAGKMNLSVVDTGGALLMISQFTLFGDVRKGKRPSFSEAMEPARAEQLFERCCDRVRHAGITVETGRFRAHMQVEIVNDGPVTILIDTKRVF